MRRSDWRYFAEELTGDGTTGNIIALDIPLQGAEVTDTLSGPAGLTGKLSPELLRLKDSSGNILLQEYGCAIWAEASGSIKGGGILTDSDFTGPEWSITCTGYAGYPKGIPYTDKNSYNGVEVDPLDGVRAAWAHLQSQPKGDLGLIVDSTTTTGLKVGTALTQDEFDAQGGSQVFEAGPLAMHWYDTSDIGQWIDDLANQYTFDYHERHQWEGDELKHYLDFGYPRIGDRRDELAFVIGVNVQEIPQATRAGEDYTSDVQILGNGDGPTMIRGYASRPPRGIRKAVSVENKDAKTTAAANADARKELTYRNGEITVTDLVIADHKNAPLGSFSVGDEIPLLGRTAGWLELEVWVRVLSVSISPESGRAMKASVIRSDKLT